MNRVKLTNEEIIKCKKFAEEVFSTNQKQYAKRNQKNQNIIKHQILIGKLGEIATWKIFKKNPKIKKLDYPDFSILPYYKKSFDADLLVNDTKKIHVKSQDAESARRYGVSWTFQWNGEGTGHTDPILRHTQGNKDEYVAFVGVDLATSTGIGYDVVSVDFLHAHGLFGKPKLRSMQNSKKVVYYEELLKLRTR